jgi:hypothetical protein
MEKKKVIIHYNNLSIELQDALREKYPDGYQNHTFKVTKPNKDFFYAVTLDTKDASYLVKVDVKIDNITENKLDDAIFANIDTPKVAGKIPDDDIEDDEPDEESKPPKPDTDKDNDLF